MVLRILRRVARAWVPEDPASTRAGRGSSRKDRLVPEYRPKGEGDLQARRTARISSESDFYQLISEAGSFRSLCEVHTDVCREAGFPSTEGAPIMVYSVSSFATLCRLKGSLPVRAIHKSYP
jgi:hypothetical protein